MATIPGMPLAEGAVFAGYTIVRLLGAGAMGEVYLAEHPRLPRRDALKVLATGLSSDQDYRLRFAREADLAAKLWYPHIVGVHDRGEDDGQLWISMDYVEGIDAARLLERYPAGMPVHEVAAIVTAIAAALDYAHKQGLLHRDVKPTNIMLTDASEDAEQRILLADFGIARSAEDVSGLTTTNMTVGTVAYSAPEQLMGEQLDGRADQYALAATPYHLLTGAQPFPHSNPAVVISHHLNADPPTLPDTRRDLAGLDPVLAAAMAKDPTNRFERCSDFARAFTEQANSHQPVPTAPTTPTPLPGHAAGRQPRRGARAGTRGPRAAGDRQRARFTVTRDASPVSQSRIRGPLPALQFREVPSATGNRASWPPNQCGRPISDDRLDVELALLACHWFGQSVLAPADRS
jgi:serine/threonine protein kinase, bacterial